MSFTTGTQFPFMTPGNRKILHLPDSHLNILHNSSSAILLYSAETRQDAAISFCQMKEKGVHFFND